MKRRWVLWSIGLLFLVGCTAVTTSEETAVPPDTPAESGLEVEPTAMPDEDQAMNDTPEADATPTEEEGKQVSEPITVDLGDVTPVVIVGTPNAQPAPGNPALKAPVIEAMVDLGNRLNVPEADIELVSLFEVTWRDGSLGCPESSMNYIQVLTPGQQLILRVSGQEYHYHSGKGGVFSYCGDPQPPLENIDINPNQPPPPGQNN